MNTADTAYANSPEAENLLWHLRMFDIEHVLFGADFPIFTFEESLNSLRTMGLTEGEIEKITNELHNLRWLCGFHNR